MRIPVLFDNSTYPYNKRDYNVYIKYSTLLLLNSIFVISSLFTLFTIENKTALKCNKNLADATMADRFRQFPSLIKEIELNR